MAELHLLRPWWLLAIPVGVWLAWRLLGARAASSGWRNLVDPQLRAHVLAEPEALRDRRWPALATLAALTLAALALAGPTWERVPVPTFRSDEALVVALDLSRSMDAADVQPSRLQRAKLKLLSLLERRTGGQTALVVFSAHAFTVTPLTTDTRAVAALVGALSSDIMPSSGSRVTPALVKAGDLLRQGSAGRGEILLITDAAVGPADRDAAADLRGEGFRVHVLAVGTEQGAPIPQSDGGFLTDRAGRVVVPQVQLASLRQLAAAGGGRFAPLAADDRDLDALFAADARAGGALAEQAEGAESMADVWRDAGVWLALALLPLLALGFRRGWIAGLAAAAVLAPPGAEAFEWSALWQRDDQRGYERLQAGEAERAAELFVDPEWRSAAQFRADRFAESAAALDGIETADAHYNRGTALAKAGLFAPAIGALERALEIDPEHQDARFNLELLRALQEENPEQAQDSEADEPQGGEQQQNGEAAADERAGAGEQGEQANEGQSSERQDGTSSSAAANERSQDDSGSEERGETGGQDAEEQQAESRNAEEAAAEALAMDVEEWASEQAAEQWLRRVQQDPGGLLRRKFLYQYQRLGMDQDGNAVRPGDEIEPW